MMYNREPTYSDFVESIQFKTAVNLNKAQLKLAKSLIDYRRKHFQMGLRGGRTTTVDLVQAYFDMCGWPKAGREI